MLSIEILLKTYKTLIFVHYIIHITLRIHLLTFIHIWDIIYYRCIP